MAKFTYIDLFAGIGGFHLAADALGGRCVFASEIDAEAKKRIMQITELCLTVILPKSQMTKYLTMMFYLPVFLVSRLV